MGLVYKAQDTRLDRIVALKFLPPALRLDDTTRLRFLQEAKAAAAITHPNVCVIHDIQEYTGQQFIVMEYVEGKTLRELVVDPPRDKRSTQSISEVLTYALQIGQALHAAHSRGIVHRDITSANIMVNSNGQVKIMDFGLAQLKGVLSPTKSSGAVGTPAYLSPEQIQDGVTDVRSDIFSFGIVLYEMLTGRLPFGGEYYASIIYCILNEEPESLQKQAPEASAELVHVVNRALEKDPDDRYQSVNEMVIDLRRAQRELGRTSGTRALPTSVSQSVDAVIRRRFSGLRKITLSGPQRVSKKRLWMVLVFVAVAATALSLFTLSRDTSERPNPRATFRVLQVPFTQIGYPSITRDGNWVAFPAADAAGEWDVYWMHSSNGSPRRVTTDSSLTITQVDISADGSQIVYDRLNAESEVRELHVVSSNGGMSKKIADIGFVARWRPDGQRIGYVRGGLLAVPSQSGKVELWSVRPDGSDPRQEFVDDAGLPQGNVSFSWSPDGKAIAWVRTFADRSEEIVIHDLKSGRERQITSEGKSIHEVCWTSRGTILFSSNRGGSTNLWMVPAKGGPAIQITKEGGPDLGMKMSADGSRLVYLRQQQIGHLWIADVTGERAREITFDDRDIRSVSFSPDGRYIASRMSDPDVLRTTSHIYVVNRYGENRRQLTSGDEIVGWPTWSPDGKWIAYYSYPVSAPFDSAKVYLIEVANPAMPRLIGKGFFVWWLDATNFVVLSFSQSWQTQIGSAERRQVYQDSTLAYPILGGSYILFYDLRSGRDGWWITESSGSGNPRMILSPGFSARVAPNGRFLLYVKPGGEIWKIALPGGGRQSIGRRFPGLFSATFVNLSYDGKELVYVERVRSSRLVMIEGLFD